MTIIVVICCVFLALLFLFSDLAAMGSECDGGPCPPSHEAPKWRDDPSQEEEDEEEAWPHLESSEEEEEEG